MSDLKTNKYGKLICELCGRAFSHLGSHIFHAHGITAREYKETYELPYSLSLITPEIKRKMQEVYKPEISLKNIMDCEGSKNFQFKKGDERFKDKRRVTPYEIKRYIARIKDVNIRRKNAEPEQCPVCKTKFENLPSHLYEKHRLIRVQDTLSKKKSPHMHKGCACGVIFFVLKK